MLGWRRDRTTSVSLLDMVNVDRVAVPGGANCQESPSFCLLGDGANSSRGSSCRTSPGVVSTLEGLMVWTVATGVWFTGGADESTSEMVVALVATGRVIEGETARLPTLVADCEPVIFEPLRCCG